MTSRIPPPIVQRDAYRFADAQSRTLAFENLLRQHGIGIQPGSKFESIALNVFQALYQRDSPTAGDADVRTVLTHLMGVNELAGLVLSVAASPEFPRLLPHLRFLNQGVGIQNMPSPQNDQATNKVFELFAGILAMHCGSDVTLDDGSARRPNPDVLVTIDSRRWGIACKCLHGDHPEGLIANLTKAVDQIEKSEAETGVVLLSIKNLLDQERYWTVTNPDAVARGDEPMLSAFREPTMPFKMLAADANAIGNKLNGYLAPEHIHAIFDGKKCIPGFLIWAHVASAVVFDDLPVPTSVRTMAWQHIGSTPATDMSVINRIHDAAYAGDSLSAPAP